MDKANIKKLIDDKKNIALSFYPKYINSGHPWSKVTPVMLIRMHFIHGLSYKDIADKFSVPSSEVSYVMTKCLGIEPQWKEMEMPPNLSADNTHIGYILGVAYGDASITSNSYRFGTVDIDFRNKLYDELIHCGFREVDLKLVSIDRDDMISPSSGKSYSRRTLYRLELNSQRFVNFLHDINLRSLTTAQKIGFIEGFFDSEGCVGKRGCCVTSTNTDKKIIDFVVNVLEDLGIKSSVRFTKRSHVLTLSGNNFKDIYTIYVGKKHVEKFRSFFRFSIWRKQARIEGKEVEYNMKLPDQKEEHRLTILVMRRNVSGKTTESKSFIVSDAKSPVMMRAFLRDCIRYNKEIKKFIREIKKGG